MAGKKEPRLAQKVDWHFFSFPVAFAFALGAFTATILALALWVPLFIVSLFGVSFWHRSRYQPLVSESGGHA